MDLQQLIDEVDARAEGPEPLARLRAAVALNSEVVELGDQLLDLFVDEARMAGASWAEVGEVLGVTRQAAQQRQGGWLGRLLGAGRREEKRRLLSGRFTRDARAAVVEAQKAVRALEHDHIGTEHLLLGVLDVPASPGARALAGWQVERPVVEARILEIEGRGPRPGGRPGGHLRFTPRARKVLELALREAMRRDHRHIGTEHILLALLREGGGVGAKVLTEQRVTYDAAETWVSELQAQEDEQPDDPGS